MHPSLVGLLIIICYLLNKPEKHLGFIAISTSSFFFSDKCDNQLFLLYFITLILSRMEQDEQQRQLAVSIQLSPIDENYYYFDAQLELSEDLAKLLVNQTYFFFVIELRTGIKPNDIQKIVNYFLSLSEEIIQKEIKGISFVINGHHHIIQNFTIQAIKQLFAQTFVISKEDDYSVTLTRTRHAIQSVAQKLNQTNITLLFFFSHIEISHTLGVKKRSYINKLNEHAEVCWDEVNNLSKAVKRFTENCKTYIISYDKEGEQQEDYSLCDTDLMNQIIVKVGKNGTLTRNYSYNQLGQAFEQASALMLYKMYSLDLLIPVLQNKDTFLPLSELLSLSCENTKDFRGKPIFIKRRLLDSVALREKGLQIVKSHGLKVELKELEQKLSTVRFKANVNYCELSPSHLLISRCQVACLQISNICRTLSKKIITYRRRYEGGKSYIDMQFDKEMFLEQRDQIENHYQRSKEIFTSIREGGFKGKEQFQLYEAYNELKRKIDNTRDILVGILKKQIGGSQIGKLSQVINLSSIKNSLKNKLLKRINANPFLLDQVYDRVRDIINHGQINFPQLEVDHASLRSNLGNCVISDHNFVKAMLDYDALGIAFEIQRPMSAIADPGRLRIRQVSPSLMRVSSFFQKFLYRIQYTPETVQLVLGRCRYCKRFCDKYCDCDYVILSHLQEAKVHSYKIQQKKIDQLNQWNQSVSANTFNSEEADKQDNFYRRNTEIDYLRDVGDLNKHNYKEKWDYINRVQTTQSVLGFMPLYLTEQHWRVAKQLMKPCLAFTATGQPLGYIFSQFQTIPFMLLSAIIKTVKELQYSLEDDYLKAQPLKGEAELNKLQTIINRKKQRLLRFKHIQEAIEVTCKTIMNELSSQAYELPLNFQVKQRYIDYKEPINRTVDIISNNSCFLGQIYTAFKYEFMAKPLQQDFHQFFVRLIQEELRRETEAWAEQETQDAFVNKILNLDIERIKKSQNSIIIVTEQDYASKFYQALQGYRQQQKMIQVHKQQLQMMLRKEGKFNDNQRLLITEYQRMYINRVLWMWYVRFLLYTPLDKVFIRRWKSLGITNSYMLFTLIIQNKKQTKNHQRREAIIQRRYVDPFDYYQAREYLENEFTDLYDKTLNSMKKQVEYKKASGAAQVFAATGNLDEAAGVILNADSKFIRKVFETICHKNVPLFAQKLGMMVHGNHRGVRVTKWIPGRKKMNLLRNRHQYEFQCYQYMF